MQSFTPPLSLSLSLLFTNAHYTVCVCEYPSFKVLHLFSFREGMWGTTAPPVSYRGMYEVVRIMSTWSLHFSIHLRSSFAHLGLPNHSDFHCILTRCRGTKTFTTRYMAFPFNQTACERVGVYLPLERKWNSIAIIESWWSEQCSRYPVLNYLIQHFR